MILTTAKEEPIVKKPASPKNSPKVNQPALVNPEYVSINVQFVSIPEKEKINARKGIVTTRHAAALRAGKQLVLQKFDENGVARNKQKTIMRTGSQDQNTD